jgi:hypothetical protein
MLKSGQAVDMRPARLSVTLKPFSRSRAQSSEMNSGASYLQVSSVEMDCSAGFKTFDSRFQRFW